MILTQQPQPSSPVSEQPVSPPRPELTTRPLTWLWPGHIPQGKLTLLDGSPNCGTTLFSITLAACGSAGLPLPDGTTCPQGMVLFIAPHDNFRATLLPRLNAAGARQERIRSLTYIPDPTATAPQRTRPISLVHDLALLESAITTQGIVLLILDPYTAFPGWRRALPNLIKLAQRTNCAIVLTRSLSRAPSDPLHPHCPASSVLTAARSHLLLAPDPRDERHCLLLTPKHSLCAAPSILAYTITTTAHNQPLLSWLPAPDPTELHRLCTGPIRSPHRRAILRFLRECPNPCHIKDILNATSYDYEAGRKMLTRMQQAGELISLDRGLYTTSDHPCLAHFANNPQTPAPSSSPVPVPNVPPVGADLSCPSPIYRPSVGLNDSQIDLFNRLIASGEEALVHVHARLLASVRPSPIKSVSNVPSPSQISSTKYVPTIPSSTHPVITLPPQAAILHSQKNMHHVPIVPTGSEKSRLVKI